MTTLAPGAAVAVSAPAEQLLRNRTWDRWFTAGGAWLVPIPILAFYLFRSFGAGVSTAEDLVTLLVMVPLGGPHVFATYTRTYFNPAFRKQEPLLFWLGLCVPVLVVGAAVSSAFFDVLLAGAPPIRYVLSFFFFWAGIHIVHQHSYVASGYTMGVAEAMRPRWGWVDYAVMLLAMYPVSFFRMSMIGADPTMREANPDALATQIVLAITGSAEAADQYVFRIGRTAPLLPEFMMHPAVWIATTVLFVLAFGMFVCKSLRERREGTLIKHRFRLVLLMGVLGSTVPLLPNLDSAFQGLNAWHSFQYLGLAWLMNRRSYDKGQIRTGLFARTMHDGSHWRFFRTALGATLGAIAVMLLFAWLIASASDGRFAMFGHAQPPLDDAGKPLYRPGAVLLTYYLLGFSFLLVHYLHDGFFFCRRRYLRD
tara:strand:+ start:124006 stop:125277 length:1272 start_codon:yes stop_codon:yes gene_type:complete